MRERTAAGDPPAYTATNFDVPVVTMLERDLQLYVVDSVADAGDGDDQAAHVPAADGLSRG